MEQHRSLHHDLKRGMGGRPASEYRPPEDQFPPDEAIAAAPHLAYNPAGGFLLGRVRGKLIGTEVEPIMEDRHLILTAASRAGKGVSIIIPNLLRYKGSIMALDPKGELASITSRTRDQDLHQKICVLDPFRTANERCAPYRKSFNPMSILRFDNEFMVEDCGLIADALVIQESGQEPHWNESARRLLESALLFVATAAEFEGRRNLVTVYRVVGGRGLYKEMLGDTREELRGMEALKERMFSHAQSLASIDPYAADAIDLGASDFFERPENERLSVLSSARRHVYFLGYPALRRVLEEHDFDLDELKTAPDGMTIYL